MSMHIKRNVISKLIPNIPNMASKTDQPNLKLTTPQEIMKKAYTELYKEWIKCRPGLDLNFVDFIEMQGMSRSEAETLLKVLNRHF